MEQALLRHDHPKGESGRSGAVTAAVQPFDVAPGFLAAAGSCMAKPSNNDGSTGDLKWRGSS